MDKRVSELEENRKLQKEIIRNLQISVESFKRDKENLAEELKTKDETIHKLNRNKNMCLNGCDKYNKSMDEVVAATAKHREAVITLKEVCEKQKKKIKEYEKEVDLYEIDLTEHEEKIKQLEEDVDIGYNLNVQKREELEKLHAEISEHKINKIDMKDVIKKLEKKQEISDKVITNLKDEKKELENKVKKVSEEIAEK